MLLICLTFSGCSSRAKPLTNALAGLNFAPTAAGLSDLLTKLPLMTVEEQKDQLRLFTDAAGDVSLKRKSAYVLGKLLQRGATEADLREAIDRYSQSGQFPPLAERAQWHISQCAQAIGDEKLAARTLDAIARATHNKETRLAALYGLGQSYMRSNERDRAQEVFDQICNLAPESQFGLGSTYYLAVIETARASGDVPGTPSPSGPAIGGNARNQTMSDTTTGSSDRLAINPAPAGATLAPAKALAAFRHYLDATPDGRFSPEIVSQLQNMHGFEPTAQDHTRFARVFYAMGHYSDALNEWRKAGNTAEWYKQAMCLLRTGRANEGKLALQAGLNNHPADGSVLLAATTLCRYLTKDGASAVWKGVLQRSPKVADIAMYQIATRAPEQEALNLYHGILAHYPQSSHAADAAWWCAWSDIKAGNGKQALSQLQQEATSYPDARPTPRCMFWIGKVHERLGQKPQAKAAYAAAVKLHARSYYGHRAQARLAALSGGSDRGWSIDPDRKVAWAEDTAEEWAFPEPPQDLARQQGATIETLTELKQWDECLELLPEKTGLLRSFYLAKNNMTMQAINAAYATLGTTPERTMGWQLAYPLLYARTIASEAPAKKLDPFLVQALIREESRYNVQAVSASAAIGLMQLMPGTAYGVAKRLGIKLGGKEDIHKPENNLRLGIDYLSYVLNRARGNALHAVASYNGGPNAVAAWAVRWPGDTDVFVENIPFTETRDYVRKVFGSYWNYLAVYQTPTPAASRIN